MRCIRFLVWDCCFFDTFGMFFRLIGRVGLYGLGVMVCAVWVCVWVELIVRVGIVNSVMVRLGMLKLVVCTVVWVFG